MAASSACHGLGAALVLQQGLEAVSLVLLVKLLIDIVELGVCPLLNVLPWVWVTLSSTMVSVGNFGKGISATDAVSHQTYLVVPYNIRALGETDEIPRRTADGHCSDGVDWQHLDRVPARGKIVTR